MVIRQALLMGALAAVVAGCQTPIERETHALLKACSEGDQRACTAVPLYQDQQALEIRRRRAMLRGMIEGAAIGGEIGGKLGGGGSTVYIPPTPQPVQLNCMSMSLGGGMVATNCQ